MYAKNKIVAGLFSAALLLLGGRPLADAQDRPTILSADDPRPVAAAVLTLESLYGWAITYEDPRYVHPDDLRDVTWQVRRDMAPDLLIGRAPKVLIPRGGKLTASYGVSAGTGRPHRAEDAIQQVLDARIAGS